MSHYNSRAKACSRYAKGKRERKHTTTENQITREESMRRKNRTKGLQNNQKTIKLKMLSPYHLYQYYH